MLARWQLRGAGSPRHSLICHSVLPPIVTGYLLLVLFAPRGAAGQLLENLFGVRLVFTWFAAVLASAVMSFPLMVVRCDSASRVSTPGWSWPCAAWASRWRTFFAISLPLARRGVIAAATLGFARRGEFGATIMVAGDIPGETRTIPLEIFSLANRPGGMDQGWRLVAVSILLRSVRWRSVN